MRPLGVTLVGLYQILRGLLGLLFGLSVLLFTGLVAKLAGVAAEGNALGGFLHGLGRVTGLGILAFAVIHILAGYGVLQMQNWGRLLTLFFSAVGLVLLLPGVVHVQLFSLFFGAINAASIFYLQRLPSSVSFTPGAPWFARPHSYAASRVPLFLLSNLSTMNRCPIPHRSKKSASTCGFTNILCSPSQRAKIMAPSKF